MLLLVAVGLVARLLVLDLLIPIRHTLSHVTYRISSMPHLPYSILCALHSPFFTPLCMLFLHKSDRAKSVEQRADQLEGNASQATKRWIVQSREIGQEPESLNSMLLLGGSRIPYSLSLVPRLYYRSSPYPIACRSSYISCAPSSMLFALRTSRSLLRTFRSSACHSLQRCGVEHCTSAVKERKSDTVEERQSDRVKERWSERATKQ